MKSSIDQYASYLARETILGKDLSLEIAKSLAIAWFALHELEKQGVDIKFNGKNLVEPHLERAWRELLKIRADLPADKLDVTEMSKLGRIFHAVKVSDSPEQDPGGHA